MLIITSFSNLDKDIADPVLNLATLQVWKERIKKIVELNNLN